MPNHRGNPNAGSLLFEAIRDEAIQKFIVREREIGHFEIDHGKQLFLVTARSSGGSGWTATLGQSLLQKLIELNKQEDGQRDLFGHSHFRSYFWIACGDECCELYPQEWKQIVDLTGSPKKQMIYVERPHNCSFRVQGSAGKLPHTVPRERFPSLAVPA